MRSASAHKQAALRAIGPGMLLAMATGVSGCAIYTEDGALPEVFCGVLYSCGSGDRDNNRGGNQNSSGTTSSDSSTGDTSSGEGTPQTGGD
jgi:hypothetical protein